MRCTYKVEKIGKTREKYIFNMSLYDFFNALSSDNPNFINMIINIFINSEFKYVYWQFPCYSQSTKFNQASFEFIFADSFEEANSRDFADKFIRKPIRSIITFENKSGDTELISVVPTMIPKDDLICSDIMSFMVNFNKESKINLLNTIGKKMLSKNKPCYLSTHGRGVPWIHIRICDTPKYYV